MTDKNGFLDIDENILRQQRDARQVIRRDAIAFVSLIGLAVFLFLAAAWFQIPFLTRYIPFLVFLLVLWIGMNWRQWAVLKKFNLHCPHCGQPLFSDRINLLRSPSNRCPACGRAALAPISQLRRLPK